MTALAPPASPPPSPPPAAAAAAEKRTPWLHTVHPVYRMIVRWAYIALLTLFAFYGSLQRTLDTTRGGGMGGYVWVVPLAALLAAIGIARRNRTELPIHDRQTDVIVGVMGLVLALLLHAVLLQRYFLYVDLLRLDLVAMWVFVISASIGLFGLRPVIRFGWVWALLLMVFPLPYYLIVILLGGNKVAAGIGTLVIAGFASGIAVNRHTRRGATGTIAGWAVGLPILAGMSIFAPDAPLLAYQLIPAITAICLVGIFNYFISRIGIPKLVLKRKIEPLAANEIWSAVPVVLVVAIALSFVRIPAAPAADPLRVDALSFDSAPGAPTGWDVKEDRDYPWVSRVYGQGAHLLRQKMVADTGDVRFDKSGRPRAVVVDSLVTDRPYSLGVYPTRMVYNVQGVRFSPPRPVDLGFGVHADLVSVVDDNLLVTWDAMQWTWTNGRTAQRILVIAVDNHEEDAPFPQPTGAVGPMLNSMFTVLFRGNSAATTVDPNVKDDLMLREFSHALVRAQLEPLGVKP